MSGCDGWNCSSHSITGRKRAGTKADILSMQGDGTLGLYDATDSLSQPEPCRPSGLPDMDLHVGCVSQFPLRSLQTTGASHYAWPWVGEGHSVGDILPGELLPGAGGTVITVQHSHLLIYSSPESGNFTTVLAKSLTKWSLCSRFEILIFFTN